TYVRGRRRVFAPAFLAVFAVRALARADVFVLYPAIFVPRRADLSLLPQLYQGRRHLWVGPAVLDHVVLSQVVLHSSSPSRGIATQAITVHTVPHRSRVAAEEAQFSQTATTLSAVRYGVVSGFLSQAHEAQWWVPILSAV